VQVNVIRFYLVTYIRTILSRVLAMPRQEALVIITVQQLIALNEAEVPPHTDKHQPKQAGSLDRQSSAHLADFGCLELCILENKYDSLRRGRYCFLLRFYRRCAKTTNHFNYANICRNALKVACAVQILALSDRFLSSLSEIYCPSAEHQGHVAIRSNYGALKTQL